MFVCDPSRVFTHNHNTRSFVQEKKENLSVYWLCFGWKYRNSVFDKSGATFSQSVGIVKLHSSTWPYDQIFFSSASCRMREMSHSFHFHGMAPSSSSSSYSYIESIFVERSVPYPRSDWLDDHLENSKGGIYGSSHKDANRQSDAICLHVEQAEIHFACMYIMQRKKCRIKISSPVFFRPDISRLSWENRATLSRSRFYPVITGWLVGWLARASKG